MAVDTALAHPFPRSCRKRPADARAPWLPRAAAWVRAALLVTPHRHPPPRLPAAKAGGITGPAVWTGRMPVPAGRAAGCRASPALEGPPPAFPRPLPRPAHHPRFLLICQPGGRWLPRAGQPRSTASQGMQLMSAGQRAESQDALGVHACLPLDCRRCLLGNEQKVRTCWASMLVYP